MSYDFLTISYNFPIISYEAPMNKQIGLHRTRQILGAPENGINAWGQYRGYIEAIIAGSIGAL